MEYKIIWSEEFFFETDIQSESVIEAYEEWKLVDSSSLKSNSSRLMDYFYITKLSKS